MDPDRRAALVARVERLASALDVPIDGLSPRATVAIGLGLRAGELYGSIRHAGSADATAATIILRPLVELVILLRWIEAEPELRIQLWLAEDDRDRLVIADRVVELHRRRGRTLEHPFSPQQQASMNARIAEARRLGRAAGSPRRGSLLPPLEHMARTAPDMWELYEVAFRGLSAGTHSAPSSMVRDAIEQRADGRHLVPGPAWLVELVEELAATATCAAIETVSRQAGLPLEADAMAIRQELAQWANADEDPGG